MHRLIEGVFINTKRWIYRNFTTFHEFHQPSVQASDVWHEKGDDQQHSTISEVSNTTIYAFLFINKLNTESSIIVIRNLVKITTMINYAYFLNWNVRVKFSQLVVHIVNYKQCIITTLHKELACKPKEKGY